MSKNENLKTLLVIDNGFDLAHELKTKYTHFLDLFNKEYGNIEISEQNFDIGGIKEFFQYIQNSIDKKDNSSLCKNLEKYMQAPFGNIWTAYFSKILEDKINIIGENWIDFEREIERVIKQIEQLLLNNIDIEDVDSSLKLLMGNYLNESSEIITQKFIPKLYYDLKILTLFLEQYLIREEKNLKVAKQSIIKDLNINSVISYNYTNTFQRLYDPDDDIPVYFIHGKLGKHNLVLGIGETLSDDLENQFTICASFKKFFQRVKYKLGNDYRNILPSKPDANNKWQIVIYGHSLDVTDEDSLKWLLKKAEDFKIQIYYFDDNAYNQQIANAIQIIGKKQLIKYVNVGQIIFKPI